MEEQKLARIQAAMSSEGFDALFLRLSVNVLAFTGHWSGNHAVAAVIPASGTPVLLLPETEFEEARKAAGAAGIELVTYPLESTTELRGPMDGMTASALPSVFKKLGVASGVVGIEKSFEDGASARLAGDFKYPADGTWDQLSVALPGASLRDATTLVSRLRWVKSALEIEKIRKAVRIACKGFEAVRRAIRPGMSEGELSGILESEIISQGTGKNGGDYSRGFSSIYAGPRSAMQWTHYAHSSGNTVGTDQIAIMELGSVTDGYWADLTRIAWTGKLAPKVKDAVAVLLDAQAKGLAAAKPGEPIGGIDKACHDFLESKGYGPEFYNHACGHGVGYNYHEAPPVHAAFGESLEPGMVLCIEPGLYFRGEFGVRTEDMMVITEKGAELISDYPHLT